MRDDISEIRSRLNNPQILVESLGLEYTKTARGVTVRCPWHAENLPSCSVSTGHDGTIQVRCFGCQKTSDVIGFVGAVRGAPNIAVAIDECRKLCGIVPNSRRSPGSIGLGKHRQEIKRIPPVKLYEAMAPVDDVATCAYLRSRLINASAVNALGLARQTSATSSATGESSDSWHSRGYRLVFPVYDHRGSIANLRARGVTGGFGPKSLPLARLECAGMVLANEAGAAMLASGEQSTLDGIVIVTEGEIDFALAAIARPWLAVLGLTGSGSWSTDIAFRIPNNATVIIATDDDPAGDRYALMIHRDLAKRCQIRRIAKAETR